MRNDWFAVSWEVVWRRQAGIFGAEKSPIKESGCWMHWKGRCWFSTILRTEISKASLFVVWEVKWSCYSQKLKVEPWIYAQTLVSQFPNKVKENLSSLPGMLGNKSEWRKESETSFRRLHCLYLNNFITMLYILVIKIHWHTRDPSMGEEACWAKTMLKVGSGVSIRKMLSRRY